MSDELQFVAVVNSIQLTHKMDSIDKLKFVGL